MYKKFFITVAAVVAIMAVAVPMTAAFGQTAANPVPHPGALMVDLNATDRQVRRNGAVASTAHEIATAATARLTAEVDRLNTELAAAKRGRGGNAARINGLKRALSAAKAEIRELQDAAGSCSGLVKFATAHPSDALNRALEKCYNNDAQRAALPAEILKTSVMHAQVAIGCAVNSQNGEVDCSEKYTSDNIPSKSQVVRLPGVAAPVIETKSGAAASQIYYTAKARAGTGKCRSGTCKVLVSLGTGLLVGGVTYVLVAATSDDVDRLHGKEVRREPNYGKASKMAVGLGLAGVGVGFGLSFAF